MTQKGMSCPAGTTPRGEWDFHNPFGASWDSQTDDRIQQECCLKNCFTEMNKDHDQPGGTKKKYTCDAGKAVRHKLDFHNQHEFNIEGGNSWDEDRYKSECCEEMRCWSAMEAKSLTCDGGTKPRHYHDGHRPWGDDWDKPDAELKRECCVKNCAMEMEERNQQCPADSEPRGPNDWHQPFWPASAWSAASDNAISNECCMFQCNKIKCPLVADDTY